MFMEVLAVASGFASILACVLLLKRLRWLEDKVRALERRTHASLSDRCPSILGGKRVLVHVSQDHDQPLMERLLAERLALEDALIVSQGADLEISGSIQCNGYSDIYFSAEFEVTTAHGLLCHVSEKPPHGDRPHNLVQELVARVSIALEQSQVRHERSEALQELDAS